jgi:hypothetical protein
VCADLSLLRLQVIQKVGQIVRIFEGKARLRHVIDQGGQTRQLGSNVVSCGQPYFGMRQGFFQTSKSRSLSAFFGCLLDHFDGCFLICRPIDPIDPSVARQGEDIVGGSAGVRWQCHYGQHHGLSWASRRSGAWCILEGHRLHGAHPSSRGSRWEPSTGGPGPSRGGPE